MGEIIELEQISICPECKSHSFEVVETLSSNGPFCRCLNCGWSSISEDKKSLLVSKDKKLFYVIGGKYIDTTFTIPETELEKLGPFDEYMYAHQIWMARSMFHVDSCLTKYVIVEE